MTKLFRFLFLAIMFASPFTQALGPGSSGGGNGVGDAPIEAFAFDPAQEHQAGALYRRALQILVRNAPCEASRTLERMRPLAWYQVPRRFSELPQTLTGLPFVSNQIAIQNFQTHEIWIDQKAYHRMSTPGKATLLLHESILGSVGDAVTSHRNHASEDETKDFIASIEAVTRKVTAYIIDPRNQKKDRLSYLEGLYAHGIEVSADDFWCSNVIKVGGRNSPIFSDECAEITDVNTHEKFQLDRTMAMYTAQWTLRDETEGKGQICHQHDHEQNISEPSEPVHAIHPPRPVPQNP